MVEDDRVAEFVTRNHAFSKSHQPIPLLKDTLFAKGPDPRGNIVIISCFDVRVQPTEFFGLKSGEANILNNAGGRVDSDAIRSLIVLDSIAGVGTVVVVHHTDCGLTHSTDKAIRGQLEARAPNHVHEIAGMNFGEIKDVPQSVQDDMDIIKSSPYFKKELKVLGFVYDIEHGTVAEVKQ